MKYKIKKVQYGFVFVSIIFKCFTLFVDQVDLQPKSSVTRFKEFLFGRPVTVKDVLDTKESRPSSSRTHNKSPSAFEVHQETSYGKIQSSPSQVPSTSRSFGGWFGSSADNLATKSSLGKSPDARLSDKSQLSIPLDRDSLPQASRASDVRLGQPSTSRPSDVRVNIPSDKKGNTTPSAGQNRKRSKKK